MEIQLLKSLLNKENYNATQLRIKRSLFADEHGRILDLIKHAHDDYDTNLSAEDLYALWLSQNPLATTSQIHEFRDNIENLASAPDLNDQVAADVIENLWRQSVGEEIATLGLNMRDGDIEAMTKLKTLLEKVGTSFLPDKIDTEITETIDELIAFDSDESKWRWNIPTLHRNCSGIGPGNFAAVFARTEAGKTCFAVSTCAAPNGFAAQGARVHYLCNEEPGQITKKRAVMAYAGIDKWELETHNDVAKAKFKEIEPNLRFFEINGWDINDLDGFLTTNPCDVVVLDQIDKLEIGGQHEGLHRKLGALYQAVRQLAKRHSCAIICVTQASIEADNKLKIIASMMADSKTSKQAELDLIIGIGMAGTISDDGEDDNRRWLNISKNKLSPFHGQIQVEIQPKISRFVA